MGNVNTCLSNAFEFQEIKVRPLHNIITNKSLLGTNSEGLSTKFNLFDKQNLENIEEEEKPKIKILSGKKPKDRNINSITNLINEESITTPKNIKIIENNFNNNFNNKFNNNDHDVMFLDNNVYFNSTRKSKSSQKSFEYYNSNKKENNKNIYYNNDLLKNNEFKDNANIFSKNGESDRIINTEEDSSNLIVLEYNRPETPKNNYIHNINNVNYIDDYNQDLNEDKLNIKENPIIKRNFNQYNNNDYIINNDINIKNNDINKFNDNNGNESTPNYKKINNINNSIKKVSYNSDHFTNFRNSEENKIEPQDNKINIKNNINKIIVNNLNNNQDNNADINKNTEKTVRSDIMQAIHNYKNNIPYVKPRFNSNYNEKEGPYDNKKNINLNAKNISNQIKSNELKNNIIYYNSRNKNINTSNSFQVSKKSTNEDKNNIIINQNNIKLNNKYDKNKIPQKFSTYNQEEPIKFITNSRKLNSESKIIQKQSLQNTRETNEPIHYNKTSININNNKINDISSLKNNKNNSEINDNKFSNINNYNIIDDNIISSKNGLLQQNNEENISPDERILFQSANLDNIPEEDLIDTNDILRLSASHDNNDSNIIEQEISSSNNNKYEENKFKVRQRYEYTNSNEQIYNKQPISENENNYDYDKIIIQQKEQIKRNPEYEQTQQAQDEEKNINEFQQNIISKAEEPKDKDSDSEIGQKMKEQVPLTTEKNEFKLNNIFPKSIDRTTLNKKNSINEKYEQNINIIKNIKYEQEINKNKSKIKNKINLNKNQNKLTEDYVNKDNFNDEQLELYNPQDEQFFSIPLTSTRPFDKESQSLINKKTYISDGNNIIYDKFNDNNINIESNINNNNNDNIDIKNNNYIKKFECKEFEDFSIDSWKRFYSEDERLFNFSKEELIHNQLIINNLDSINEEIYKGDINKKGEKEGFGIFISPNIKRIGMWREDRFTGWGREIYNNGEIFEGKFINGQINGKGIYKNINNKNIYIGDFINSMRNGKGELYTNEYHYQGEFYKNKINGKGKMEIYNEGEYEGTFKDNQFDGKGMLKFKNGKYYIGSFSKGKMNGFGEEYYSDGTIYKGNFVKGVKKGHGKLIKSNGEIIDCEFENDKPI